MTSRSTSPPTANRPNLSLWRLGLPLLLQVALVLIIPAQAAYTYFSGNAVILQTVPVDPYSLLQGYYVILRYDISQIGTLEQLPGWSEIQETHIEPDTPLLGGADSFYVILEEPDPEPSSGEPSPSATNDSPPAWTPVRIVGDRPNALPDRQIALQGRYHQGQVLYGLEQYFIPEDQRDEINDRIRETQSSNNPQSYVVEVSVSRDGNAVPRSLWIDGKNYRF